MFAKVLSSSLLGIDAYTVTVEAHLENASPPKFFTVGLPEGAVKESQKRVVAAIKNSGFRFPSKRITVNLALLIFEKRALHLISSLPLDFWLHWAM